VFILLDPLDGTREFLADGDSFCVCLAVIVDGRPVAGALAAPMLRRLWYGGERAFERALDAGAAPAGPARPIRVRALADAAPIALVSRFHGDATSDRIVASFRPAEQRPVSSAVKFGLIAAGEADLHVRGGPTMEWDIAAGEAILTAAGGALRLLDGGAPRYGRIADGFRNPPFVAAASAALATEAARRASGMPSGG